MNVVPSTFDYLVRSCVPYSSSLGLQQLAFEAYVQDAGFMRNSFKEHPSLDPGIWLALALNSEKPVRDVYYDVVSLTRPRDLDAYDLNCIPQPFSTYKDYLSVASSFDKLSFFVNPVLGLKRRELLHLLSFSEMTDEAALRWLSLGCVGFSSIAGFTKRAGVRGVLNFTTFYLKSLFAARRVNAERRWQPERDWSKRGLRKVTALAGRTSASYLLEQRYGLGHMFKDHFSLRTTVDFAAIHIEPLGVSGWELFLNLLPTCTDTLDDLVVAIKAALD